MGERNASSLLVQCRVMHAPLAVLGYFQKSLTFDFNRFLGFFQSMIESPFSQSRGLHEFDHDSLVGNPTLLPANDIPSAASFAPEIIQ